MGRLQWAGSSSRKNRERTTAGTNSASEGRTARIQDAARIAGLAELVPLKRYGWTAAVPGAFVSRSAGTPPKSAAIRNGFVEALTIFLGLLACAASFAGEPLIHAHAHNDYEHKRPLLDALDNGFCGIEADIYLVEGKLLVAHNLSQVKAERTLQALYLDPLRARIKQNGRRVYTGGPQVTLLIDLKMKWQSIYPVLRSVLKEYSDILTTFSGDSVHTNALLVVIPGDRSKEMFEGEQTRYAAFDADLPDLDSAA